MHSVGHNRRTVSQIAANEFDNSKAEVQKKGPGDAGGGGVSVVVVTMAMFMAVIVTMHGFNTVIVFRAAILPVLRYVRISEHGLRHWRVCMPVICVYSYLVEGRAIVLVKTLAVDINLTLNYKILILFSFIFIFGRVYECFWVWLSYYISFLMAGLLFSITNWDSLALVAPMLKGVENIVVG